MTTVASIAEEGFAKPPSAWQIFSRNRLSTMGLAVLAALILIGILGPFLAPHSPTSVSAGPPMQAPSSAHWMGTDDLGRDVLSRVLVGIRVSLAVGIAAAVIASIVGVTVGATAGFFGGRIDDLLMRTTEVFQVIPRFFLAVVLVALFGANLLNIILAISLLSWPELARIIRAEFLTLRTRQFVDAARVSGADTKTLIFVEILPNALAPVIVNATLQVGQAMLLEAGLSYLGLGDPNQISLGLLLRQSQEIMREAWWTTISPGVLLALAVLSVNLAGDGLIDVLSPRSRER